MCSDQYLYSEKGLWIGHYFWLPLYILTVSVCSVIWSRPVCKVQQPQKCSKVQLVCTLVNRVRSFFSPPFLYFFFFSTIGLTFLLPSRESLKVQLNTFLLTSRESLKVQLNTFLLASRESLQVELNTFLLPNRESLQVGLNTSATKGERIISSESGITHCFKYSFVSHLA